MAKVKKEQMGWIKKHKRYIIGISILIILFISFFWWMDSHCNKRKSQEDCLIPIAEEYCNNLNDTLIGNLGQTQTGCPLYFPTYFTCGHKENERMVGYQEITKYKFLEEEINKCNNIK